MLPAYRYGVCMSTESPLTVANLSSVPLLPQGFLLVTGGNQRRALTELLARLSLRGQFLLIAAGEWLPDQDDLRRLVRRRTLAIKETLDHIVLSRPFTCLQLRDQLFQDHANDSLIIILDFLHHFLNQDVDLDLREQVLGECCARLQRLKQGRPLIVHVQAAPAEEYERFFPVLTAVADKVLQTEETFDVSASQARLF